MNDVQTSSAEFKTVKVKNVVVNDTKDVESQYLSAFKRTYASSMRGVRLRIYFFNFIH